MLISEMEAVLKSLDQRVGRIEQILPTLATRAELRDEIRGVKVLVEAVRDDVKVVHERIDVETAGLSGRMDDMQQELSAAIRLMTTSMQQHFAQVQQQFAQVQQQFAQVQQQFAEVQQQFAKVFRRLDRIHPR